MLSTTKNGANLYANLASMIAGGGLPPADSLLPLHDYALPLCNNPPLKDDSGLTFNNYALPLPRKRSRDSSMVNNLSFLGEDFSLQLMQQQLEAERFLSLHMEKVRAEIEERTRSQSVRVIQAIQEAIGRKLRETEGQIEKIGKLNWELEERVKSLTVENQIWRDLAQTNEATASALRSSLEQVLLQSNYNDNNRISSGADAESCCGSSGGHGDEDDDVQSPRWRKVSRTTRMCRRCAAAESSVLLLPCRHLCLCAACGPGVDACPVCNATKNASVHINLS